MRTLHMLHSLDIAPGDLGSTVRMGNKWADLKTGESIELCTCTRDPESHEVVGVGVVLNLWFGTLWSIPAHLLQYEHELRSREYNGLLASMRKAYGEDFAETDSVTVIVYERRA